MYRRDWERFAAFCNQPPYAVRTEHIVRWRDALLEDYYAEGAVRNCLLALSSFYQQAVQAGLIQANPIEGRLLPKRQPYFNRRCLSPEEQSALLAAIDVDTLWGRRDYALLLFLLRTGRQPAQALALRWGDFEVSKPGVWFFWREKNGTRPSARLDWEVWAAICMHLHAGGRLEHIQDADLIFTRLTDLTGNIQQRFGPGWDRQALGVPSVRHMARMYSRWAGLPEEVVTPKALLYTAALRHWEAHHDLEALRQFLGHSHLWQTRKWINRLIAGSADPGAPDSH